MSASPARCPTPPAVHRALNTLHALSPTLPPGPPLAIHRLPSLTNRVYRLHYVDQVLILRIPGSGAGVHRDRAQEGQILRAVHRLGLGAPIVHHDTESGLLLMALLPGKPIPPTALTPTLCQAMGRRLGKLHRSGLLFPEPQALRPQVEQLVHAAPHGHPLTRVLKETFDRLGPQWQIAETGPPGANQGHAAAVPCHGDTNLSNWLLAEDRLWLVDWEYAVQREPAWDLAQLAHDAQLSPPMLHALLQGWAGEESTEAIQHRVMLWRPLVGCLAAAWYLAEAMGTEDPTRRERLLVRAGQALSR